ncbi:MAG TPA: hypothetical protein VLZ54_07215, partial [Arenibacter sp.]|nr:hypothetical protein [Arenibacter sp.]
MKYTILCCLMFILTSCADKGNYRFRITNTHGSSQAVPIVLDTAQIRDLGLDLGRKLVLTQAGNQVPVQLDAALQQISFVHRPADGEGYAFTQG